MRSRNDVQEFPRKRNARKTNAEVQARHLAKIAARIQAGDGSGHLARYNPWLQIKRRNTSPESNQLVAWVPILRRSTHFFARGEYFTALLLLWLGAEDVREQYPLWPMPHPHPLDGAVGAPCNLPWSKGLLAIAAAAGIDHGYDVGTQIPYIATIDLLATVRISGQPKLVFISSKPSPDNPAASDWRMYERLELERRYAEDLECRYFVASSSLVSPAIASNLETWIGDANLHDAVDLLNKVEKFAELFAQCRDLPLRDAVSHSASECGVSYQDGWRLLRHCAWHQTIDTDPAQRLLATYPLPKGGRILRRELAAKLLGIK